MKTGANMKGKSKDGQKRSIDRKINLWSERPLSERDAF